MEQAGGRGETGDEEESDETECGGVALEILFTLSLYLPELHHVGRSAKPCFSTLSHD